MAKKIDLEEAKALRKRYLALCELWEAEAASREKKAEEQAAKYYLPHKKAATEARKEAKSYARKIKEIDALVAAQEERKP